MPYYNRRGQYIGRRRRTFRKRKRGRTGRTRVAGFYGRYNKVTLMKPELKNIGLSGSDIFIHDAPVQVASSLNNIASGTQPFERIGTITIYKLS